MYRLAIDQLYECGWQGVHVTGQPRLSGSPSALSAQLGQNCEAVELCEAVESKQWICGWRPSCPTSC
jgi:hypothetical protein